MNKFEGWDWTELGTAWNLYDLNNNIKDEDAANLIKQYIVDNYDQNNTIIEDMKLFLQEIVDGDTLYETPLFKGLLEIKNNEVFVKYYCELLEYMWT